MGEFIIRFLLGLKPRPSDRLLENIVAAGLAETENGRGEWVNRTGVPFVEASTAISALKGGEDVKNNFLYVLISMLMPRLLKLLS